MYIKTQVIKVHKYSIRVITLEEAGHPPQGRPRGWEVYGSVIPWTDLEQLCLSVECYLASGNAPVGTVPPLHHHSLLTVQLATQ